MVYPIMCIMPQGRVLYLKGSGDVLNNEDQGTVDFTSRVYVELNQDHSATYISDEQYLGTLKSEGLQNDSLTIPVYDEYSNCRNLTLDDVGEYFRFIYSSHLIFFHESDLRNYDTWSLGLICDDDDAIAELSCEGESEIHVESSLQEKAQTNCVPHSNDVSLKREATPSSIEIHEMLGKRLMHENLFIRYIPSINGVNVGYGLFTNENIVSGTIIGEYVGVLLSGLSEPSAYSLNYPSCNGDYEIDATEYGNIIRFVNHSSNPNCDFKHVLYEGIVHVICVSH